MKKGIPPKTYQELVNAVADLFDEVAPETPEEVDAILREAGFDPDEVRARMSAVAERALKESPMNWRNRARQEIVQASAQMDNSSPPAKSTRSEMIASIQTLLGRLGGTEHQLVGAHFRNLEQATDNDLASLLADLEYLARQKAVKGKD